MAFHRRLDLQQPIRCALTCAWRFLKTRLGSLLSRKIGADVCIYVDTLHLQLRQRESSGYYVVYTVYALARG